MHLRRSLTAAALLGAVTVAQTRPVQAQSPLPSQEDPRIHEMVAAASAARVERDIRTLVAFGTRHTMGIPVTVHSLRAHGGRGDTLGQLR